MFASLSISRVNPFLMLKYGEPLVGVDGLQPGAKQTSSGSRSKRLPLNMKLSRQVVQSSIDGMPSSGSFITSELTATLAEMVGARDVSARTPRSWVWESGIRTNHEDPYMIALAGNWLSNLWTRSRLRASIHGLTKHFVQLLQKHLDLPPHPGSLFGSAERLQYHIHRMRELCFCIYMALLEKHNEVQNLLIGISKTQKPMWFPENFKLVLHELGVTGCLLQSICPFLR